MKQLWNKNILSLCLFFVFLLFSYSDQYANFHTEKQTVHEFWIQVEEKLQNFSYEDVSSEEIALYITPSSDVQNNIVNTIKTAQNRVWLEVYILTNKDIISALKHAKNAWVDVRVILEKNVYGNPTLNKKTFLQLEESGIDVRWSSEEYVFTHSKLLLVDDAYILGTGNMSHSTFRYNRELFVRGDDARKMSFFESLFLADWSHEQFLQWSPSVIVSPIDSREKFEYMLESAQETILIYAQLLSDFRLQNILLQKAQKDVEVFILMGDIQKIASNQDDFDLFVAQENIHVLAPKKPYIHTKAIVVDDIVAYVGSQNFTQNSIDNNREVGIFSTNEKLIRTISETFYKDFWLEK